MNRVESGSISADGGLFTVDAQGRVLTVQIVGDFEGVISFEGQHEGEVGWTAVTLPSLGGTDPVVTFKYCGVAAP